MHPLTASDLVVEDRADHPVLLVRVNAIKAAREDISDLIGWLQSSPIAPRFGMMVDPDQILILRGPNAEAFAPALCFPTRDVLHHYDADFAGSATPHGSKRVFGIYLKGLVEAWLADLASRWKPGEPPRTQDLAEIGLLPRLEGGVVIEGNRERDDSLR